jgi:hypothetical protein
MRALLALQAACAGRGVDLHVELGGGEALVSRGRAGKMAQFLESAATHLLFVDSDAAFQPQDVFRLMEADRDVIGLAAAAQPGGRPPSDGLRRVAWVDAGFLLIRRAAARRISDAYPALAARLGDVRGAGAATAVMVFDSLVEPQTGRYLADGRAFCRRWRDIGGEVWAIGSRSG